MVKSPAKQDLPIIRIREPFVFSIKSVKAKSGTRLVLKICKKDKDKFLNNSIPD
ncbi:3579_t:CDS:2 [Rhizophagus irregularis]|nr:3579_t:CDS:2 [Rhizophagus irregularis]